VIEPVFGQIKSTGASIASYEEAAVQFRSEWRLMTATHNLRHRVS
jgi:hypothetical protein